MIYQKIEGDKIYGDRGDNINIEYLITGIVKNQIYFQKHVIKYN